MQPLLWYWNPRLELSAGNVSLHLLHTDFSSRDWTDREWTVGRSPDCWHSWLQTFRAPPCFRLIRKGNSSECDKHFCNRNRSAECNRWMRVDSILRLCERGTRVASYPAKWERRCDERRFSPMSTDLRTSILFLLCNINFEQLFRTIEEIPRHGEIEQPGTFFLIRIVFIG